MDCRNEDHTRGLNRKRFNSSKEKLRKTTNCNKFGDQEVEEDYAWLLRLLTKSIDQTKLTSNEDKNKNNKNKIKIKNKNKIKIKIKNKNKNKNKNKVKDEDKDDKDPQYCMFLKNLTKHGKSYKLNISKNETPCFLEYENDEDNMNSSEDLEIENDYITETNNDINVKSCYQMLLEGCVPSEYGTFRYKENVVKYEENVATSDSDDIQIMDNIKDFSEINNKRSVDGNKDPLLKEKIMESLMKPYNEKEYIKLLEYAEEKRPICRHLDLRHRPISSALGTGKKSLLDGEPYFRRKLEAAKDERPRALNLLRMFQFWLQNLPKKGSFKPWLDDDCLKVLPPAHVC